MFKKKYKCYKYGGGTQWDYIALALINVKFWPL